MGNTQTKANDHIQDEINKCTVSTASEAKATKARAAKASETKVKETKVSKASAASEAKVSKASAASKANEEKNLDHLLENLAFDGERDERSMHYDRPPKWLKEIGDNNEWEPHQGRPKNADKNYDKYRFHFAIWEEKLYFHDTEDDKKSKPKPKVETYSPYWYKNDPHQYRKRNWEFDDSTSMSVVPLDNFSRKRRNFGGNHRYPNAKNCSRRQNRKRFKELYNLYFDDNGRMIPSEFVVYENEAHQRWEDVIEEMEERLESILFVIDGSKAFVYNYDNLDTESLNPAIDEEPSDIQYEFCNGDLLIAEYFPNESCTKSNPIPIKNLQRTKNDLTFLFEVIDYDVEIRAVTSRFNGCHLELKDDEVMKSLFW